MAQDFSQVNPNPSSFDHFSLKEVKFGAESLKQKSLGLLIPAFSLLRKNDLGIGDTEAVKQAILFCSAVGMNLLELLPINETGGDNSPYIPICSFALEPALLAVEPGKVPGLSQEIYEQITGIYDEIVGASDSIQYNEVKSEKRQLLAAAFKNFEKSEAECRTALSEEFRQFRRENSLWLKDYSIFRELVRLHGGDPRWEVWGKAELTNPQTALKWIKNQDNAKEHLFNIKLNIFTQWVAHKQWEGVKEFADKHAVRLMGDIPYGISRYSSDVWANPKLFHLNWSIGAPPEQYFKGDPFVERYGQNWGGPLYNWAAHEEQDFRWWESRVESVCKYFHEFRVDHVLGFFRVYSFPWIPEKNHEVLEMTRDEVYATYGYLPRFFPHADDSPEHMAVNEEHGRKLLSMLKKAAKGAEIIAEDLGANVPEYVHKVLAELGMMGYSIFPMFRKEGGEFLSADEFKTDTLGTFGTHDHAPLKEVYMHHARQINEEGYHLEEMRRMMRALKLDDADPPVEFTPELHMSFLEKMILSPARKVVINFPDIVGSEQRWNDPAKPDGNWSGRMALEIADYFRQENLKPIFELIHNKILETGRSHVSSNDNPEARQNLLM